MVEPSARFEEIKIPLADPVHGLEDVSAVLGIPRWWPTGARVAVVFAHSASGDMNEPVIEALHREHGLVIPLSDLVVQDPFAALIDGIITGDYLGESLLGSERCHHLAFRQDAIDWQVWIAALPLMQY